ncbi:Putative ribonuclease H protein At1g65750 [Linum perenne]
MDFKLDGWKRNSLSLAGRVTLAQSVLNALPSYAMQTSTLPASILSTIDSKIRSFIWGSSPDHKKIHLLSWDTICRPKSQGGLGLRMAKELNDAFMLKIGWLLLKKPEALWVRVLTSKYLKEIAGVLEIRRRNWGSALWRGVRRVWPTLQSACQSVVHNGMNTSFWHDIWLDSGVKLSNVATRNLDRNEAERSVLDATDGNGNWDWGFLASYLPHQAVMQVAGMQPPIAGNDDDDMIWGPDPKGTFSLKSAYEVLAAAGSDNNANQKLWNLIWRWKGPNRVRFFLWLVAHNRILTNAERRRRHLSATDTCDRCNMGSEDVLHVLRDCNFAVKIWRGILPHSQLQSFFSGSLHDWLFKTLNSTTLRSRNWQTKVVHIFREANQVADRLAHIGHNQTLGTHHFDLLPSCVRSTLLSDCIGVSYPRSIPINT